MALAYRADQTLGNIEITLQLINNAEGTFDLAYNLGPGNTPSIPPKQIWKDHGVWVLSPVPPTIDLVATVYNSSPGGNDGDLILSLRQGLSYLPASAGNAPPNDPCDLGNIPFNQAVPPIAFTVVVA